MKAETSWYRGDRERDKSNGYCGGSQGTVPIWDTVRGGDVYVHVHAHVHVHVHVINPLVAHRRFSALGRKRHSTWCHGRSLGTVHYRLYSKSGGRGSGGGGGHLF